MFGEEILNGIKGIGEVVLKGVDMLTVSDDEKMAYKLKMQVAIFEANKNAMEYAYKNIDSARKRETETNDPTVRRLSYVYTAGYFMSLGATWHWGIPVDGHDVFVTLLGVLTAAQAAIINYYFGSSHSSASKEKIIDRVVNHKSST
jgi:hypothetical protein